MRTTGTAINSLVFAGLLRGLTGNGATNDAFRIPRGSNDERQNEAQDIKQVRLVSAGSDRDRIANNRA